MNDTENLVATQLKLIEVVARSEDSTLSFELDKLIAAEPKKSGVDFYQGYEIDQYECPKCYRPIGDEIMLFRYCPNCGQRIGKL